jgi:hypothetical protein
MNVPAFAKHWAAQLGAPEKSLVPLAGGINNRVYRCGLSPSFHVIKGYRPATKGERDRMQAEVDFLKYAGEASPHHVPRLICVDAALRCIVLEHVDGEPFVPGSAPSRADVDDAVAFFSRLNADHTAAAHTIQMDAAEGFLRLTDHVHNVQSRLHAMETEHLPPPLREEACALLGRVRKAAEGIFERTTALISTREVCDALDPSMRCISPSDFGFHNAIRTPTGVKFIDFEFAGWDDPAKSAADFLLQPRVPVPRTKSPLLEVFRGDNFKIIAMRCQALGPLLRLKWVCIMLAVLQPQRLAQIQTAHPGTDTEELTRQRLTHAAAYLMQEVPFGLH